MTDSQCWTLSCQDRGTSTSDLAKAAALEGAPVGSAFLLGEQTAGRGRRGRHWSSQPGGMYVSVLLYPSRPVTSWFAMSFATALAIYDVLKTHLQTHHHLRLHSFSSNPEFLKQQQHCTDFQSSSVLFSFLIISFKKLFSLSFPF